MQSIWEMDKDTDLHELLLKRFDIPLMWLDLERLQHLLNSKEEGFTREAIKGTNTSFTSGWLNDEVKNWLSNLLINFILAHLTMHIIKGRFPD